MTAAPRPERYEVCVHAPDPRFKYALFVPEPDPASGPPGLLATVHSSERDFIECRDRFAVWARQHHHVVLSPLFPADPLGDGNADGYKVLFEGALRYDLIFDQMVDAAAERSGCRREGFLLQGYSGGAQFVHRYWLLHARRLRAVSLGAPGDVTALDEHEDWAAGIRNVESIFGSAVAPTALRQAPLQLLVGDQDTSMRELSPAARTRFWPSDLERRNAHRIRRLRLFHASLASAGVDAQLRLMPGVGHSDGGPAAAALAQAFFEEHRA